jgi:hypothetical protein
MGLFDLLLATWLAASLLLGVAWALVGWTFGARSPGRERALLAGEHEVRGLEVGVALLER